jgi:hypothetical protein
MSIDKVSFHPSTLKIQKPGIKASTPRIAATFAGINPNFWASWRRFIVRLKRL